MRLTKNRLKLLDVALSVDDVLYERFRKLNQDLQRREARLRKAHRIIQVIQERGELLYQLQIVAVHSTPDGTIIRCR